MKLDTVIIIRINRRTLRKLRVKLLKQGKTVSWFVRDRICRFLES